MHKATAKSLRLAFLLALAGPAQAGWSCPDGTPCVHDPKHGYVCAEKKCADQASSCCVAKTTRCKHGVAPTPANEDHSRRPRLHAPDHCRFSISAPPQITAVTPASALLLVLDAALPVPAPQLSPRRAQPVWRFEFTLGYRPPPIVSSGPSRAPPA